MNLITNAADSLGASGGEIQITTGRQTCGRDELNRMFFGRSLPPGNYVFLRVEDDGCGIDPETGSKIFDPFFTTKEEGHGLSLAALSGIMKTHGGAVDIQSRPGVGTRITVYLPALQEEGEEREAVSRISSSATSVDASVPVVDDEEHVREVARAALEHLGARVQVAKSGRQAIEMFEAGCEDLVCVLLDLTMPDMDGAETLRPLRQVRADVKILIASGFAREDVLERLGECRVDGFIHKPFRLETLLESLGHVLGTEQPQS